MTQLANIVAEFYVDITALGLLAVILGVTLVLKNDWLGIAIAVVVLGIADTAFFFLEIVPGFQPLIPPVLGTIIFPVAVEFSAAGLASAGRSPA